ncbi:hypothetical protein CLV97_14011 [Planifilum fimeticola]|jgi:hypothetical protein|uniref:Uncharacterized protein n=1 Tax=Planifilum fimeticola TaxID=201975 RepID=A0A2T0LA97_9BACL|nr:hypothetical protein CLV97_14011 [Planifilum fimeticola]
MMLLTLSIFLNVRRVLLTLLYLPFTKVGEEFRPPLNISSLHDHRVPRDGATPHADFPATVRGEIC